MLAMSAPGPLRRFFFPSPYYVLGERERGHIPTLCTLSTIIALL